MAEASKQLQNGLVKTFYTDYPYPDHANRLKRYDINYDIFKGEHFHAFAQKVESEQYNREYAKLRYIVANFGGLVSKVSADMLFGEPATYTVEDEGGDQQFIENVVQENKLNTQHYESALVNSRSGDDIFKIRVGMRNGKESLIIEEVNPNIWFPHYNKGNIREEPKAHEFAWPVAIGDKTYVQKEIHYVGRIENELWDLKDGKLQNKQPLSLIDPSLQEVVETGVDRFLVVRIPNWQDGGSYFGADDYRDIISLQYGLNNRITKIDNILDKHSDPILAIPQGILDEKGQVKRSQLHMFEIPTQVGPGAPAKPEYIVWNASLESAFKEIDTILQFAYMFSETSPDVFGFGENKAESGRALKLRLLRTIAKVNRKKLYYDAGLKELLYTAQLVAKAHNLSVMDKPLKGEPVMPQISWQDGLPLDMAEAIEQEQMKLDMGVQTEEDAIMKLDGVDAKAAKKKAETIRNGHMMAMPNSGPNNKAMMTDEMATKNAIKAQDKNIRV